ncbi:MAG: hypothetical protein IKJ44_02430, partial [Elusimicrobiaceae bacterium]|nr:hypothetical protein [Elusimicrobiaceae bacterium]
PGRLFFDYEREEIIRLLKSPAMQWEWTELKVCSLGNVILSNNQVETNSDAFKYATCVKEQYMQMRSNPDAARAAEHTI